MILSDLSGIAYMCHKKFMKLLPAMSLGDLLDTSRKSGGWVGTHGYVWAWVRKSLSRVISLILSATGFRK